MSQTPFDARRSYYLDPYGDDKADGLQPSTPWQTLERASQNEFQDGDELVLKSGVLFDGELVLKGSGHVRVRSGEGGRARICAHAGNGISAQNLSVTIQSLEIIGDWDSASQSGSEGTGVQIRVSQLFEPRLQVNLSDLKISGFREAGIVIGGTVTEDKKAGFGAVTIERCIAHDNGKCGITVGGKMDATRTDWCHQNVAIRHCESYNNRGVSGLGSHTGSGIVIWDLQGGVIEHSVAYRNGELNDFEGGGPVGIWCWDCDSVTIQHCEAYENRSKTKDGGGFDLDGGCTNCVLQYNYSHDNAGSGYLICQFRDARPFHDNLVRFNLTVDDAQSNGGGILVYNDGSGISNCRFLHNTAISSATRGFEVPAPLRLLTETDGMVFLNNIFVSRGDIPLFEAVKGQAGLQMRGNLFWHSDRQSLFVWHETRLTSVGELTRATKMEPGLYADPGFKSYPRPVLWPARDWRLLDAYRPGVSSSAVRVHAPDDDAGPYICGRSGNEGVNAAGAFAPSG